MALLTSYVEQQPGMDQDMEMKVQEGPGDAGEAAAPGGQGLPGAGAAPARLVRLLGGDLLWLACHLGIVCLKDQPGIRARLRRPLTNPRGGYTG